MSIRLDLHIHSISRDKVFINERQLQNSLRKSCLDGVAITNFFDISHALWLKKKINDYIIIVGQEIWTKDGHIVGLGLKKKIADFQRAQDTIAHIHEQGGIAVAVHPCFHLGLGKKVMSLPIDSIEVYNGLTGIFMVNNFLAKRMADKKGIPQIASSDTTDASFIGYSYTEVMTDNSSLIFETIRSRKSRLLKRALPFPFGFIFKNFLKIKDLEPCSIHAVPCFICGKSMTIGIFKQKFKCLDCNKIFLSRVICCNGHYLCMDCMLKRSAENDFNAGVFKE